MSPIFVTFLFAATATAQITVLLPLWYFKPQMHPEASVIGVDKQRTTLGVTIVGGSGEARNELPEQTITFDGTTRFEQVSTFSDNGDKTAIISNGCTIPAQPLQPICTNSANGNYMARQACSQYSQYYASNDLGQASTSFPEFCSTGFDFSMPDSIATVTLSQTDFILAQVTITAGVEKLTGTSGAATTTTGPQQTGTGEASGAPDGTGAAAAMRTMGSALAGLGVAMAALVM
jgi:hypothetical protein